MSVLTKLSKPQAKGFNRRAILARMAQVSEGTYAKVVFILSHADEETIRRLRRDELKVSPVYNALKKQLFPRPPKESIALNHANRALALLKQIPAEDGMRWEAFSRVSTYMADEVRRLEEGGGL